MRVQFESVKMSRRRSGKCVECGKVVGRTFKVEHTVNPFNRNAEGVPKSREEVAADVQAELQRLCDAPLVHEKCEGGPR